MCGAEKSTAIVAITVNRVKMMRHSLSTTIAANFQSFVTSAASSSFLNLSVITRSSLRMSVSSRWGPRQDELPPLPCSSVPPPPPPSSWCVWAPRRNPVVETAPDVWSVPGWCLKSSSISNTLARRLLEDRSFNSSSRICRDFRDESGSLPGRLILNMQGSQCKKIVLIWNQMQELDLDKWTFHITWLLIFLSQLSPEE